MAFKKSNSIKNHSANKSEEALQRFASMMIERMTALKNENWEKGWFNGNAYEGLPQNFSGRTYNASNSFMLQLISSINGYSMPVFMTFKQAVNNGIHINKGAESFPVVYWDVNIKDANGNRIDYDDYKNLTKEEREKFHVTPFLKYYPVFNIDQTNFKEVKPEKYAALKENFGIPEIKDAEGMYTHNALDSIVQKQSWVCPVRNDKLSADAYYSPSRDVVVLPMKAQFKKHKTEAEIYVDGMGYYSTMLHEMAHSTGHKERLDRTGGKFGDPKYAKEELVAELTAAMIGNSMGFDSKITDNSAKYLDNWLGALKEDPKFIVSVMADVNKATEMILDKVDEQRLALGETPYLSKNMVAVDNGYSLEPEFKPAQELKASEPMAEYNNSENPGIQKQFEEMKAKHPDALILMRVGDLYELFDNDAKIASGILNTELIKGTAKDSVYLTAFNHSALDTYLPKLVKAGQRVAICEQLEDPKLTKKLVKRGITELITPNVQVTTKDLEDNLKNDNTMAKKKKKEEPVPEIQELATVNEQQVESNKEKEVEKKCESHYPSFESILKDRYDNNMVTVNGDKVSNGHVYNMKDDPEKWFFVARLNNKNLIPIQISPQDASNFIENKNIEEMMQKCYPTKLMPKVPETEFKFPQVMNAGDKNMEVEKFYVSKEKDETRQDYGKYKFFAKIDGKYLASEATFKDLNEYFDRVKTPAQIIEKVFGEKLNLASHYAQFHLPEGVKSEQINIFNDKTDPKKTLVLININGHKKATAISASDSFSFYRTKTATKEQLAAKYLGDDIKKMLSNPSKQKLEKSNSLQP